MLFETLAGLLIITLLILVGCALFANTALRD